MRFNLLITFLTLCCAHVWADGWAQVTISEKNLPIGEFFDKVTEQTGYTFFYNNKELKKIGTVNVSLRNATLEEALKQVLQGLPFRYDIVDNTVVVRARPIEGIVARMVPASALMEIHGKVTDKEGKPLTDVNIRVSGIKNPFQTNGGGYYTVPAAEEDARITFSLVGYKSVDRKISDAKDGQLDVVMEEDQIGLDEVIVTGYQEIKRDSYTGTAVTVSGEQLKQVNPQNLLQSIQTFDPSFKLLDNNLAGSNPNVMPTINVRGSSALPTSGTDVLRRDNINSSVNLPAFILDGFEVGIEKIFDLDLNRIASVTLLKDAAATAIYGSRAANGVLVITTKTPKEGKLQVSYNYEANINGPDLSDYSVLNAADKLNYELMAGEYDTNKQKVPQDQLDDRYYQKLQNVVGGVNTYWLSQPLRTAVGQKHSLYLEGGSPVFRYGIDLRYQTRPGVMKGSGRDQYSGGMNFAYNLSNKLKFNNTLTITQVEAKESPYGNFSDYVRMNPYYPIADEYGNVIRRLDTWTDRNGANSATQTDNVLNPLYDAMLGSFDKSAYTEIIDNLSGEFELAKDLRLRGQMSLTSRMNTGDTFVSPMANEFYFYDADRADEKGRYRDSQDKETYWDGNVRLTWLKQIDKHAFNVVAGANIRTELSDYREFTAIGFANDRFTSIGFAKGYAEDGKPYSQLDRSRLFGTFLSMNYSWNDKYLMDATVRTDGSSKFGVDKRLAPFWSVGLGWNLHKEAFLQNTAISQLRLRATTGQTGSVQFPSYLSRTTYEYDTGNWYSSGIGAIVNNYGNNQLAWQKTTSTDAGFDLGLFKDRIFLSSRVYRKLTKGILADITIAPSTGFSSYKENLGDMENTGFEVNFKWGVLQQKDWTVNLTANMTHNKNKIVRIANSLKAYNDRVDQAQTDPGNTGLQGVPLLRYNEGQSYDAIYAVPSLGIDPENGRELFIKKDGTLTYDWDVRDITVVGDATPTAYGFFGGTVRYKQFMLNAVFQTQFGGDMYNQTLVDRVENANPRYNVDSRVFEEKWKQPGDQTFYKNIADLGQTRVSSRFVQPDNLLALQSLYLSYDFDKHIASRMAMSSLRLALTANDLARWSSVKQERGIDYPFARSVTVSLQAIF